MSSACLQVRRRSSCSTTSPRPPERGPDPPPGPGHCAPSAQPLIQDLHLRAALWLAPPAGFEPALTAPEAVALSPELWGLRASERVPAERPSRTRAHRRHAPCLP